MAKKKPAMTILDAKSVHADKGKPQGLLINVSSDKILLSISSEVLSLHNKIVQIVVSLLFAIVVAGRQLTLAKLHLPHGEFTPWVRTAFDGAISFRTAQRYMMVAGYVRDNMPKLRAELLEQLPELDVSQLDDETVLRRLQLSSVMKLIAKDQSREAEQTILSNQTVRPQILRKDFSIALLQFLGTPALIATSIELAPDEIASPEIVTGKAPVANRHAWPQTVLAILKTNSSINQSIEAMAQALELGSMREGLALVPVSFGMHDSIVNRPQLVFTKSSPFNMLPGKAIKEAMTLVLFSDVDRVADFADAFETIGIVKVPFVPTTKKN